MKTIEYASLVKRKMARLQADLSTDGSKRQRIQQKQNETGRSQERQDVRKSSGQTAAFMFPVKTNTGSMNFT